MRSSAVQHHASTSDSTCAVRLWWVNTTPFGRLVVPLVKRTIARRDGSTLGKGGLSSGTVAIASRSRYSRGTPQSRAASVTSARGVPGTMMTMGDTSSRSRSNSETVAEALNGTTTPPARQQPHWAATWSPPAGMARATRASFRSAAPPSNRAATAADAATRSP